MYGNPQKSKIAKAILKKNGTREISLLDFSLYYKAAIIKTVWYWHKNRNRDQWKEIESTEKIHTPMDTLSLRKEAKIHNGEDSLFNKWCWENWSAICKRRKLEHFLPPYTKINSKWIKDVNVRPETTKLLEENIGRALSDKNHSKILYDPPPRVMEIKVKINKWGIIKLKSFCTTNEIISEVKKTAFRMGEKNYK